MHDLPDRLQDFREKLVDERSPSEPRGNPAPKDRDTANSSHELPMESRANVEPGSGKHSVYTHFPKDPNCDICLKTKIARASRRRRAGTVVPTAEKFRDLITADQKILMKEVNHATITDMPWWYKIWQRSGLQSYPCKTKTSQETQKNPMKFLEPTRKPKVIYTHKSLEFLQVLWRIILESLYVNATQIRNKWDCRRSSAKSESRDICGIVAIRSGWTLVGGFHGVLHPSAKHSGFIIWWEDAIWKAVRNTI